MNIAFRVPKFGVAVSFVREREIDRERKQALRGYIRTASCRHVSQFGTERPASDSRRGTPVQKPAGVRGVSSGALCSRNFSCHAICCSYVLIVASVIPEPRLFCHWQCSGRYLCSPSLSHSLFLSSWLFSGEKKSEREEYHLRRRIIARERKRCRVMCDSPSPQHALEIVRMNIDVRVAVTHVRSRGESRVFLTSTLGKMPGIPRPTTTVTRAITVIVRRYLAASGVARDNQLFRRADEDSLLAFSTVHRVATSVRINRV